MSRSTSWSGLLERLMHMLSTWKSKSLSIGGRLTLLKSVLGLTGMFHMSVFPVPISVIRSLEALRALRARFFWGGDLGERCMHCVSWDRVLASKKEGGLGAGNLFFFL